MRRYETIFISDPDIPDENRDTIYERVRDIIDHQDGLLARIEQWGTKRLAYGIRKKVRGHYTRLDYCGTGALVNEIERFFRIDDRILKFMTVLMEKKADPDRIKAEMAQIEAQETEAQQSNQEPTEQTDEPGDSTENPLSDADSSNKDVDDNGDDQQSEPSDSDDDNDKE